MIAEAEWTGRPLSDGRSTQVFDLTADKRNLELQNRWVARVLWVSLLCGGVVMLTAAVWKEGLTTGLFITGVAGAILAIAVLAPLRVLGLGKPLPDGLAIESSRLVFTLNGKQLQVIDLQHRRRSLGITTNGTKSGKPSTWPGRATPGIPRGPWISSGVAPSIALSREAFVGVQHLLRSIGWRERVKTLDLGDDVVTIWNYSHPRYSN